MPQLGGGGTGPIGDSSVRMGARGNNAIGGSAATAWPVSHAASRAMTHRISFTPFHRFLRVQVNWNNPTTVRTEDAFLLGSLQFAGSVGVGSIVLQMAEQVKLEVSRRNKVRSRYGRQRAFQWMNQTRRDEHHQLLVGPRGGVEAEQVAEDRQIAERGMRVAVEPKLFWISPATASVWPSRISTVESKLRVFSDGTLAPLMVVGSSCRGC